MDEEPKTPGEDTVVETPAEETVETPVVDTVPGEPEKPAEEVVPAVGEETPGQEPAVEKTEVPVENVSQAHNVNEQPAA